MGKVKTDFFKQDKTEQCNTDDGTIFELNNELILMEQSQILYKINFDKNTCVEYNSNFDFKSICLIPNKMRL